MAVQAVMNTQHIGHLWGDVAALFAVAGVLAYLIPSADGSGNAACGLTQPCRWWRAGYVSR